jgi:hypothetical protein
MESIESSFSKVPTEKAIKEGAGIYKGDEVYVSKKLSGIIGPVKVSETDGFIFIGQGDVYRSGGKNFQANRYISKDLEPYKIVIKPNSIKIRIIVYYEDDGYLYPEWFWNRKEGKICINSYPHFHYEPYKDKIQEYTENNFPELFI